MRFKVFLHAPFVLLLLITALSFSVSQIHARPKRDHLTPKEADMVRDTQELDKRIDVLVKAAERRILALMDPSVTKTPQQDSEIWGELKGTRADFLYDLSRILDEAITNIDDLSSRDDRNPLIPKAVRKLADASSRFLSKLAPFRDKLEDGPERSSFERAIENAQSIVEAARKLPPPVNNSKKKVGK